MHSMTVVRHTSAASRSRHADVDASPYSGRPGTARQLQPKQHPANYTHYQTIDQALSPETQLRSPPLYSSGPISPGAVSWASGESSQTGTSYELARRRDIYTTFHTPTSSPEASPPAGPDTPALNFHFWSETQRYAAQNQHRPPSDPSLSPPLILSGLGLPLNHNIVVDLPGYPPHNVELLPFQATSPQPRQTRPGVRWRPLSPDARENAGAVRDIGGSCIRCTIMRERCDTEVPCSRCVTKAERARSWKLPCSRTWLNERGVFLLPDKLTLPLKIENVNDFINNSTFFPLENSALRLPLWLGFGQPLVLEAVEVDPYGPNLTAMKGFGIGPVTIQSPPIVPRWPVDVNAIYSKVRSWMNELLTDNQCSWSKNLFPTPYYPAWLGETLTLIHQHFQGLNRSNKDDSCIVATSLRLSIAVYVMSHALTVPQNEIMPLFSQLRHADFQNPNLTATDHVSSRAATRVVKAIVMHMVRHLVDRTFEHIHLQLGPKPPPSGTTACFESAFSASFLILTALAKIQTSLYERALVLDPSAPASATASAMDEASRDIATMETELTQFVVYLFLYKYRPKKRNASTRSPTSSAGSPDTLSAPANVNVSFREQLQGVLQRHKHIIRPAEKELSVEPGGFEELLFQKSGVKNIARVLARLCAPLIED